MAKTRQQCWLIALAIGLCFCALSPTSTWAANVTWNGAGGNDDWANGANWTGGTGPGGIPGPVDNVTIDASGPVLLTNSQQIGQLTLNGQTLTFEGWDTILTATNVIVTNTSANVNHTADDVATANTPDHRVYIVCTNLTVHSNASINVNARGHSGGTASHNTGYGLGGGPAGDYAGGGGHGGKGGQNEYSSRTSPGYPYGSATAPIDHGSGGGRDWNGGAAGSAGGGSIRLIVTDTLTVDGDITANGGSVAGDNGAGAGGGIHITCDTLTGGGNIQAKGGVNSQRGAGGGGGRIAVYYTDASGFSGSYSAIYGTGANNNPLWYGHEGTLYVSTITDVLPGNTWATDEFGIVISTNNYEAKANLTLNETRLFVEEGVDFAMAGAMILTNDAHTSIASNSVLTCSSLSLHGDSQLYLYEKVTNIVSGTLSVLDTADIVIYDWYYHPTNSVSPNMIQARDMTVASDATVNADGQGYRGRSLSNTYGGPGQGANAWRIAAGGGYGGKGGNAWDGNPGGSPYGSNDQYCVYTTPTFAGSGGGYQTDPAPAYGIGGHGGGVVRLNILRTLTVDGRISSDGGMAVSSRCGGGSGGSVYISCRSIQGNGIIRAKGGDKYSGQHGGGGGGGRIAVWHSVSNYMGTATAPGGLGSQYSGLPGTVHWEYVAPVGGTVFLIR